MTIAELRKEAVRALGGGATAAVHGPFSYSDSGAFVAVAEFRSKMTVLVEHPMRGVAMRALYAALREIGRSERSEK